MNYQEQKFIQKNRSLKMSLDDYLLTSCIQYYINPLLYILVIASKHFYNQWILIWIPYSLIPLLDIIFPIDLKNPTTEEQKKLSNSFKFKLPLYLCVFCDWFNLFYTLEWMKSGLDMNYFQVLLYLSKLFAFIFVNTNSAAANINLSHELIHKDNKFDKLVGTLTLWRNMYLHFAIEHVFGHHKNVCTPMDPATSKRGQSLYDFLPRTIVGQYYSAWNIENNRCLKKYKTQYTLRNVMYLYTLSYMILPIIFLYNYGFWGMVFFLGGVYNGIIFLEVVNYIEHYGLSRKEISAGVYEQVNITHSWNAPHRLSNYLLFKLQRHSDHHENAYKPYQTLCTYEKSPQLPHGYTVCIFVAMYPKMWMKIMDQQLESFAKHNKYVFNEAVHKEILNFIFKVSIFITTMMMIGFL